MNALVVFVSVGRKHSVVRLEVWPLNVKTGVGGRPGGVGRKFICLEGGIGRSF